MVDWRQVQRKRHGVDVASGDICIPTPGRLKRRALGICGQVGRLASLTTMPDATVAIIFSQAVSAANIIRLDLSKVDLSGGVGAFERLADAAGRFADACEKLDHVEDGAMLARDAIADIVRWCQGHGASSLA
jgi:phage tail tape-measure protein